MNRIVLYGGTGQSKVINSILPNDTDTIAVIDDTPGLISPIKDVPIFEGIESFLEFYKDIKKPCYFLVTIGNPHGKIRQELSEKLINLGLLPYSCISDKSLVYCDTNNKGLQIHPGATIMVNTKLSDYCIINTKALVEHDCILENGVEIGPNATVAGEVYIGENTWIGAGAIVRDKLKIGKNVIVGAGAVVIKHVPDSTVVVGNPAKFLRKNN